MAIRWNEYRKRRLGDIRVWADNLKLITYEDISNYLWDVGVMPPERDHKDVLFILSRQSGSFLEESVIAEKAEALSKPSSGRREKSDSSDHIGQVLKSKPTAGRVKIESSVETEELKPSQKKRKPARRRSSTKKSAVAKRPRSKKKSE